MLALISDLHANAEALQTVFEHIESQGIEEVVCLGDLVGYLLGPFHQIGVGHDLVNQADTQGLGGIEGLVGQQHLHGVDVA